MPSIYRPILWAVFLMTLSSGVFSQPPQRIIVQFKNPLTETEQYLFRAALTSLIPPSTEGGLAKNRELEKLEQSTAARWVLKIDPALDKEELKSLIEKIEKIDLVRTVEQDRLMKPIKL